MAKWLGHADPEGLVRHAAELGLGARLIAEGARLDPEAADSGFDLATLTSSHGEGFSNAIGEALPCVVTGVGDSGVIMGDTGVTAAPRDPVALAEGWRRPLELPDETRSELGMRARGGVCENFSLDALSESVSKALEELVH